MFNHITVLTQFVVYPLDNLMISLRFQFEEITQTVYFGKLDFGYVDQGLLLLVLSGYLVKELLVVNNKSYFECIVSNVLYHFISEQKIDLLGQIETDGN